MRPTSCTAVLAARVLTAFTLLGLAPGCFIDTQLYPGMLKPTVAPLPAGTRDAFPEGPEEAYVIRQTDTVRIRSAETTSSYALTFYDKLSRINAGSWVLTGPTGRAVVLLPGATEVSLSGPGSGVVGSKTRREPAFTFVDVTTATVTFGESGQIQLPGGALLESSSGPFVLEAVGEDVIRIRNRCSERGRIAYRDAFLTLEPSETVDLPILSDGTSPYEVDSAARTVISDGGRLELRGAVDVMTSSTGTRMRAAEGGKIRGMGLDLTLEPGDEVLFEGLGSNAERRAVEAAKDAAEGNGS